jgi:hypothetical protein
MSLIDFSAAAKAPPPTPRPGRDRTGPPPDAFASLLDEHQARTATAEGLPPKDAADARAAIRGDRRDRDADANSGSVATPTDQPSVVAAVSVQRGQRPDTPAPEPDSAVATREATVAPASSGPTPVVAAVPGGVQQAIAVTPAVGQPDAPTGIPGASALRSEAPVAPATTPAANADAPLPVETARDLQEPLVGASTPTAPVAAAGQPSVVADAAAEAVRVDGTPQARQGDALAATHLQAGAHAPARGGSASAGGPSSGFSGETPSDPSATSNAPLAAATRHVEATTTGPEVEPATATSAPLDLAPPAPLAASSATNALAAPAGTAVPLARAAETVQLALRAATERGVTRARISLTPAELGGIEIHLRHTAEGLVARVVAEHAGAAHLLQQAGAELRRSLEAQGVTLLRLDVGASGHHGGQAAGQSGSGGAADRSGARAGADVHDADGPATGDVGATPDASLLTLPNGVLVDVLA